MGYLHIDNLYKNTEILMFKECYAMEKIHGTSARIYYKDNKLGFHSGGEKHSRFIELFDQEFLIKKIKEMELTNIIIYGEAYGGKQQGMKDTYGVDLKFIAFEVRINNKWLDVPIAEKFVKELNLEFVYYVKMNTDIKELEAEREKPSVQSIRNGIQESKRKEGLVLRPLKELTKNNGGRIIAKYKNDEFIETNTKRIIDPEKLKVLEKAKEVAGEWVTEMRLSHVLDKVNICDIQETKKLITAMLEDIKREGRGEILWSKQIEKCIGKKTAMMFKKRLNKLS